MKLKPLLIFTSCAIIGLASCKKDKASSDETTINTVYWDNFKLPASAKGNAVVLQGQVGNSKDVDSLKIDVNDKNTGKTLTSITLSRKNLTLSSRKDWPTSTVKWYDFTYKPSKVFTSGDQINFILVAYTPFGISQDLRSKTTASVEIE